MSDSLYLAWRYMRHHWIKTAILVASITLIVFLPAGLQVMVSRTAEQLAARARSTPLIVGRKGSALELALNSLYFESKSPDAMRMAQATRIRDTGLARAIPLHVRFRTRQQPIVGTTLDYLAFRGLRVARGRRMALLGECVVGADAAWARGVGPGDSVVSAPQNIFDLAGVYPLKMRVVGVLARTFSPDDDAVFVDVKTAWVIEGLAHGHAALKAGEILSREGGKQIANASVVQYTEITPENIDGFHFHGDPGEFPVTAILAVPHDAKRKALLMGRFLGRDEVCQIVEPADVMDDLIATVVKVRSYVVAAVVLVGSSTLVSAVLVFLLSLRLRRREMETMRKIGCSRWNVSSLLFCEILIVVALSVGLAAGLAFVTNAYGPSIIREFIL
jgi:putative ABC transport system permease protein